MNKQEFMAMSLPYGLSVISDCDLDNNDLQEICIYKSYHYKDEFENKNQLSDYQLPILRPLSDLSEEIEHKGEKIKCWKKINNNEKSLDNYHKYSINQLPFWAIQLLVEWHFDICGLIEKGEAIDYHTISDFVFSVWKRLGYGM